MTPVQKEIEKLSIKNDLYEACIIDSKQSPQEEYGERLVKNITGDLYVKPDCTAEEMSRLIVLKQLDHMRAIKYCALFFVILTLLGFVGAIAIYVNVYSKLIY